MSFLLILECYIELLRVKKSSIVVQIIFLPKFIFEITISFLFYGLHRLGLYLSFICSRQCQPISLGNHKDSARWILATSHIPYCRKIISDIPPKGPTRASSHKRVHFIYIGYYNNDSHLLGSSKRLCSSSNSYMAWWKDPVPCED